nr:MAG TPA: hypothetical protein [Caudoviricetes sp.]
MPIPDRRILESQVHVHQEQKLRSQLRQSLVPVLKHNCICTHR